MPAEFGRVNWGAYLVPPFWAWFYGLRGIVIAYVAVILGDIIVANAILFLAPDAFGGFTTVSNRLIFPLMALASVVLGLTANRLLWRTQQTAWSGGPSPARPVPLWRLRKSNRFWFRIATALFALSLVGIVGSLVSASSARSVVDELLGPSLVFPIVYIYDLWLGRRARAS